MASNAMSMALPSPGGEKVKFTVHVRGHQWSSARHIHETLQEFAEVIQVIFQITPVVDSVVLPTCGGKNRGVRDTCMLSSQTELTGPVIVSEERSKVGLHRRGR